MVYLGSDHGGFELKEIIKKWLAKWGYRWEDCGNTVYDRNDDYPQFAFAVAERVVQDEEKDEDNTSWKNRSKGILCCRSGAGMVIASCKVKGARAVAAFDIVTAKHSREHNNANILALSGDFLSDTVREEILKVWLETEFSGEDRHKRRLRQIEEYEIKVGSEK